MSDLRTAAQQALKVLEAGTDVDPIFAGETEVALRAALAQQDEPLNLRDPAVQKRLAAQWGYVPAAQAEPVEPVAWTLTKTLTERKTTTNGFLWFSDPVNSSWTALYTAPPQRTMVPLTEEEIDALPWNGSPRQFARAVEKTSWEKNHGQA